MDLFEYAASKKKESSAPLASRMRPRSLDEIVGQEQIIGKGRMLYRAIKADRLRSIILYGPPGTGKTTLAEVIAHTTSAAFMTINATSAGKKDMEEVVSKAKEALGMYGRRTILFIDEIHRFNKGQQDFLLPFVEDGTIILIGANDISNGNFVWDGIKICAGRLADQDLKKLLPLFLKAEQMGKFISIDMADGDARAALNALELGILTTERSGDGQIHVTLEVAQECIQKRMARYDKDGDQHYDTISAFIKSMRGSDPDAAVFYLARMLNAGEDIRFLSRRIMICAAEDVGCADPMAIVVAASAAQAVERIGMPESQLILAEAAIYVATAPKSNSATEAIFKAEKAAAETKSTIPPYLQDAHYSGSSKLNRGIGYEYAHDFPKHFSKQRYLPEELGDIRFYQPSGQGYEETIRRYLDWLHEDLTEDSTGNYHHRQSSK